MIDFGGAKQFHDKLIRRIAALLYLGEGGFAATSIAEAELRVSSCLGINEELSCTAFQLTERHNSQLDEIGRDGQNGCWGTHVT